MTDVVQENRNASQEHAERKNVKELIKSYEQRAKAEHDLLVQQSDWELSYQKRLKPNQLPVRDARVSPDEPGGIIWTSEKRASLAGKRTKAKEKASENEETGTLSEDRIQANKQWLNDIRSGVIQPNSGQRGENECVWCLGPVEAVQHTLCRCWQCSKPKARRITSERYNALVEKELGFPLPAKNCTCAPAKGVPVRCADCQYRGSLKLFSKKLRQNIIDPGHNVVDNGSLVLAPGRECLCRTCVDSREHLPSPGTGRCSSCVWTEEWRNSQYKTGAGASENPYRKEQMITDKEVIDFITQDHNFVHHENTRRKMDNKIVREQLLKANDEFLGCDRVLVQVDKEVVTYEVFDNLTPFERALKHAGQKEVQQIEQGALWRQNNRQATQAATMDNHETANPNALYPWEKKRR